MTEIELIIEKDAFIGALGAHKIEGADEAIIGFDYNKEVWVYDQDKLISILDKIGTTGMFGSTNKRIPVFCSLINK